MTEQHRLSDAETAAMWAATALTEGRYALGRALANLAVEAARHEAAQLPAPIVTADPRSYGEMAKDAMFGEQTEPPVSMAATGRCIVEVARGAYLEPCHAAAYWSHGNIGDADHPAVVAGWYHMDPDLDRDHQANVGFIPTGH